jgi:hypothetical protein
MPLQPRHGLLYPSRKEVLQNLLATDGTKALYWPRVKFIE